MDANFPTLKEILEVVRKCIDDNPFCFAQDAWYSISEHWDINFWQDGKDDRFTIYPCLENIKGIEKQVFTELGISFYKKDLYDTFENGVQSVLDKAMEELNRSR